MKCDCCGSKKKANKTNVFEITIIIETNEEFKLNESAKMWLDRIFNSKQKTITNVERLKGKDLDSYYSLQVNS